MLSRYSLPVINMASSPPASPAGSNRGHLCEGQGSPSRSSARLIHFEPVEAAEAHQWLVGHRKQLCVGCGGVLELGPARHREGIAALPCQALVARNSLAAPLDAAKDAVGTRALAARAGPHGQPLP